MQYLYSNAPLPTAGNVDITRANGTRRIANGVRDISGMAAPGTVAELRVDGRVEARARVRLDGSYDFPEVELPTRGYSEVLVFILDNRSGALLDTQDFSRRSGIELLADGQHSVFTALGQHGNVLDNRRDSLGASTAAQWRYGLTEDLTIELGRQQVGKQFGTEAALSMAFSSQWFASLGVADIQDRSSVGMDIEGGNDIWRLDVSAREFNMKSEENSLNPSNDLFLTDYTNGLFLDDAFDSFDSSFTQEIDEAVDASRQWSRSLSFRYQVNDNLSLGLVGKDTSTNHELHRFLLPTASWTNRRNLTISARPNSEGEYRVDSRFTASQRDTVRYAYENNSHLLDYRRRSSTGREYYASFNSDEEMGSRLEMGLVSHFDNPRYGSLQLAMVNNEDSVGYAVEWEATFIPGMNSQLRLSQGKRELEFSESDSKLFLQWHVTFDFAVAQNRIVPADSSSAATTDAALTGELLLGGEKISSDYDIDRIELLINGNTYTAKVQAGRYYIEGLNPGLHKISIDSRYLPMELSPKVDQNFWVRLDKSAATEVPLNLEVKYSVAGRVRDEEGTNLVNERLIVLNSELQPVGEIYTDQFGLYRTDNFAPGRYHIVVSRAGENVSSIELEITDSYMFEQNLIVPIVPTQASIDL
ncbi:MAG: hypothetical protein GKR91_01325 [Pseudomonadales bacterium]|nr:hypothetical protein [Pseudomonadales bacterium]